MLFPSKSPLDGEEQFILKIDQEFQIRLSDRLRRGLKNNHGIDNRRALVIVRRVLVEWQVKIWLECV